MTRFLSNGQNKGRTNRHIITRLRSPGLTSKYMSQQAESRHRTTSERSGKPHNLSYRSLLNDAMRTRVEIFAATDKEAENILQKLMKLKTITSAVLDNDDKCCFLFFFFNCGSIKDRSAFAWLFLHINHIKRRFLFRGFQSLAYLPTYHSAKPRDKNETRNVYSTFSLGNHRTR